MAKLEDLAERVDRLVLRHRELKRATQAMAQQLAALSNERDSLRSRLAAARARIDALLLRLPAETTAAAAAATHTSAAPGAAAAAAAPVTATAPDVPDVASPRSLG